MKNKLILIPIIFLLSCYHQDRYPNSWQSIDINKLDRCPDISGEYQNEGESGNLPYKPELSLYLIEDNSQYKKASHVIIFQTDLENVDITLLNNGQVLYKRTLSKDSGDFYCKDGFLIIKKKNTITDAAVAGIVWDTIGLAKSGNDLVLKDEHTGVMLICLFPAVGSGTSWYKFKPL